MNASAPDSFEDYVSDLRVGGLKGRCWRAPASDKRVSARAVVAVYGHHSSLERNLGLAQYLRRFGRVVIPDLPGFGGMDSFYAAGRRPTLDSYADYLKTFLDGEPDDGRPAVLVGFSLGFLVITRFLQRHPAYRKRVSSVVSVAGFVKHDCLKFGPARRFCYMLTADVIGTRLGAAAFRRLLLNKWVLRRFYARTYSARRKFAGRSAADRERFLDMEVGLWHLNDPRTWAFTAKQMLTCDLTGERLKLRLLHLDVAGDQFLDAAANLANLKKTYGKVETLKVQLPAHAPSVIASAEEIEAVMPAGMAAAVRRSFRSNGRAS